MKFHNIKERLDNIKPS